MLQSQQGVVTANTSCCARRGQHVYDRMLTSITVLIARPTPPLEWKELRLVFYGNQERA